MRDHMRLMQYASKNGPFSVKQVQQRGVCMFISTRSYINCPFEWTNTVLHRQVAAHIIHNVEFLTQEEKDDYEAPGPFSQVTYQRALIKKFYGDEIVLIVVSMMWQVCISILTPSLVSKCPQYCLLPITTQP